MEGGLGLGCRVVLLPCSGETLLPLQGNSGLLWRFESGKGMGMQSQDVGSAILVPDTRLHGTHLRNEGGLGTLR